VERVEERRARGNEDRPERDGAGDAPEQDAVLVPGRYGEVREPHREQEHVVHRERPLDEVAGEVLASCLGALPSEHDATGAVAVGGERVERDHAHDEHARDEHARREPDAEIR
jgi:hypothetical protein